MIRSMLVALDGTEFSKSAMELGIQWATRMDAMIVGLGIVDEPEFGRPRLVPLGAGHYQQHSDEVRLHQARRRVEGYLEQFGLRCAEAEVSFKELEDEGSPHEQILREAQRYDLILMGQETHFRHPADEGNDETLRRVIRNAPRPVVVVPPRLESGHTTLVAFDGSLPAARAVLAFQASGLANFGSVHVVAVGEEHGIAARNAERAVDFLAQHDIAAPVSVLVPRSGGAGPTLLHAAREMHAGLIVMGAYGQSTFKEFFLGSVTRMLLEKTHVPLFVYH